MVLEAGGLILDITYTGGFLYVFPSSHIIIPRNSPSLPSYDMSFADHPNPLDNMDETCGGGYITLQSYPAGQIPHPNPLGSHPTQMGAGAAAGIFEHMNRFGLVPASHTCNGRDKPCGLHCQYRLTSRPRASSVYTFTQEDLVIAPRLSDSPPQLEPTKRTSLIHVDDIMKAAESSAAQNILSPQKLKRHSLRWSRMLEPHPTLTWLEDQETRKRFDREFEERKAQDDEKKLKKGIRARPTAIFGTLENNPYMMNCRPEIPSRSSSLGRTSSEPKVQDTRRDSVVTAVHELSDPVVYPQTPLSSVKSEDQSSLDAPVQPPNSASSNEPRSPMFSELSSDTIVQLQKKLTGIRESLGGA